MAQIKTKRAATRITPAVAIGWFATVKNSRSPFEPTIADVSPLVETVNELPLYTDRELKIIDPDLPLGSLEDLDEVTDLGEFKQVSAIGQSLRVLKRKLPQVIELYQRNELDRLVLHRLKQLDTALTALAREAAYLFQGPKPGGTDRSWHVHAHVLRFPIERILKKLGRTKLSTKPTGPLVRILGLALKATTGRKLSEHTISTELNRARRRRGSRSPPNR
jgi:hypothetical protein